MKTVSIISFIVVCMIINHAFLENHIIPDPCRYHLNKMPLVIDLFYNTPLVNNGHPVPSFMNHALTIGIGALIGHFFYEFIEKVFIENQQEEIINK